MRYLIFALGMLAFHASSVLADSDITPFLAERWKHRPLVIIASDEHQPMLQSIHQALQDPMMQSEFNERAMVIYIVTSHQATRNGERLTPGQSEAILKALKHSDSDKATAYLIGLDGGIKLIQKQRIDLQAIFTLIDGMPMRQWQSR